MVNGNFYKKTIPPASAKANRQNSTRWTDEKRKIKLLNTRAPPARQLKKQWCVKGLARNLSQRFLLFQLICVVS